MSLLAALFRRRMLRPLWRRLHGISLVGLNYWASEFEMTGERQALNYVAGRLTDVSHPVIFDVGANVGDYSVACLEAFGAECHVHAFEPAASTFAVLQGRLARYPDVTLHKLGLGDRAGTATLRSSGSCSSIASLVDLDRPVRPFADEFSEEVETETIDSLCERQRIDRIDFLKLDIEGFELAALRGAERMIREGNIRYIQFEFGENNVSSRTFLADFARLLADYILYQVVPGGPVRWCYDGGSSEIFATMNYLAERIASDRGPTG